MERPTPRHVAELELSGAALACLQAIGISSVDQLAAYHPATELANHPLVGGMELFEIISRLNEHGHSLPMFPTFTTMPATDREQEMLRLRLVDGYSLTEIGQRLGVEPRMGAPHTRHAVWTARQAAGRQSPEAAAEGRMARVSQTRRRIWLTRILYRWPSRSTHSRERTIVPKPRPADVEAEIELSTWRMVRELGKVLTALGELQGLKALSTGDSPFSEGEPSGHADGD
jgi:hypothetical protein